MSDLPQDPFEYTTLDLFVPFEVRDAVKKRIKKKVWGVVYGLGLLSYIVDKPLKGGGEYRLVHVMFEMKCMQEKYKS